MERVDGKPRFPFVVQRMDDKRLAVAVSVAAAKRGGVNVWSKQGHSAWLLKVLVHRPDMSPDDLGYLPPRKNNMKPTPARNTRSGEYGIATKKSRLSCGEVKFRIVAHDGRYDTYWVERHVEFVSVEEYEKNVGKFNPMPGRGGRRAGAGRKKDAAKKKSGRKCLMCGKDPYPNYFYCSGCHHRVTVEAENGNAAWMTGGDVNAEHSFSNHAKKSYTGPRNVY